MFDKLKSLSLSLSTLRIEIHFTLFVFFDTFSFSPSSALLTFIICMPFSSSLFLLLITPIQSNRRVETMALIVSSLSLAPALDQDAWPCLRGDRRRQTLSPGEEGGGGHVDDGTSLSPTDTNVAVRRAAHPLE